MMPNHTCPICGKDHGRIERELRQQEEIGPRIADGSFTWNRERYNQRCT